MYLPNHELRDRLIEGVRLELTRACTNFLGPNLIVRDSEVILEVTRKSFFVVGAELSRCAIRAKRPLTGVSWCSAFLRDCAFLGKFSDCDFGQWPDESGELGGIERCDFSPSVLDGCRFMSCREDDVALPRWPCFSITDLLAYRAWLVGLKVSGPKEAWRKIELAVVSGFPKETSIYSQYFPSLLKRYALVEDDFRETLASSGIVNVSGRGQA